MVSRMCVLVELGPICNSMEVSLCLKSCEDHSLLKIYNGSLWKNNNSSGPYNRYFIQITISRATPWNLITFESSEDVIHQYYALF